MKIALCLIIKDENDYLDEWINYHLSIGIDYFFIYDNNSKIPIKIDEKIGKVIVWNHNDIGTQMVAYLNCCKNNKNFDYIGFLDTDEFYVSKTMNIKKDFEQLKNEFGDFDGIGLYWRMYGKPNPYLEKRINVSEYINYHYNNHIKSFFNPNKVTGLPNPHFAFLNGKYIDENGNKIIGAIGNHTSKNIWIKHTWTRSISEYKEKLQRGSGDKVIRNYTMNNFYEYNDKCTLND